MDNEEFNSLAPEMQAKRWNLDQLLYIMDYGDGKRFKIGISSDPFNRAISITRGAKSLLPDPLEAKILVTLGMTSNPYYLEQLLHMHLYDKHAGGEWFELDTEELTRVVSMIQPFGFLEYTDDWYEFFKGEGWIGFVINDIYPSSIEYSRDIHVYRDMFKYYYRADDAAKQRVEEYKMREPAAFEVSTLTHQPKVDYKDIFNQL